MNDEETARDAITKSPEALAAKAEGMIEAAKRLIAVGGAHVSREQIIYEIMEKALALDRQAIIDRFNQHYGGREEDALSKLDQLTLELMQRDTEIAALKQRVEDAESAIVTGQGPDAPYTTEEKDEGVTLNLSRKKYRKRKDR